MGVVVALGAFVGKDGEELGFLDGDGGVIGVHDVCRGGEERLVVADGVLAGFVEVGDEFVELAVSVVAGEPQRFTVVRVVGAATGIVVLLLTLVQDGDAVGDHGVRDDVGGCGNVTILGREAWVVVVLAERS